MNIIKQFLCLALLIPGAASSFAVGPIYGGGGGTGSGDALTSGTLAQFAPTTSLELRGVLTDEVGTGAFYTVGGALGTPASATLTNATGLPITTGVSGLGAGWTTTLSSPPVTTVPNTANLLIGGASSTAADSGIDPAAVLTTPVSSYTFDANVINHEDIVLSSVLSGGTFTVDPGKSYYGSIGAARTFAFSSPLTAAAAPVQVLVTITGTPPYTITYPTAIRLGASASSTTLSATSTGTFSMTFVRSNDGNTYLIDTFPQLVTSADIDSSVASTAGVQTLTNKRITARVNPIASSATPTVNTDNTDAVNITALAANITSMTTSLTGTPQPFDMLMYRIKDNGTARTITWGASFASRGATLPTVTVSSKVLYVLFIWNSVTSTWDCVSSAQES